jgi:hypothetical protein
LLPLLADRDAVTQILIEEHLVTVVDQPPAQFTRQLTVLAGVTDEYLGHPCPRANHRAARWSCSTYITTGYRRSPGLVETCDRSASYPDRGIGSRPQNPGVSSWQIALLAPARSP